MVSKKTRVEQQVTLIFLNVLKDFYPRIVQSNDERPVWEEVLEECQKQGIFMDKSAEYLAKKRWPASVGIVNKFTRMNTGPLSEKDQLIVQIERHRTPDFVYGRLDGDDRENRPAVKAAAALPAEDGNIEDDNDDETYQQVHEPTLASFNGKNEHHSDDGNSSPDNPTSSSRLKQDATSEAADDSEINNASLPQPASINAIVNEPNQDLRDRYYDAAIRAFNICSELAEAKLQMMHSRNIPITHG